MSVFDRFRKKLQPALRQEPRLSSVAAPPATQSKKEISLREEVGRLYDRGVNPLHAISAMSYDVAGKPITDTEKLVDIYLGINDLLDRDDLEVYLRSQLVAVRDVLGKSISDSGPGPKTFITTYRENTRRINELKILQSYKLEDANGVLQFDAVKNMLTEIEHERNTNPGSLAQDISDEKIVDLYRLVEHWNDPIKLN